MLFVISSKFAKLSNCQCVAATSNKMVLSIPKSESSFSAATAAEKARQIQREREERAKAEAEKKFWRGAASQIRSLNRRATQLRPKIETNIRWAVESGQMKVFIPNIFIPSYGDEAFVRRVVDSASDLQKLLEEFRGKGYRASAFTSSRERSWWRSDFSVWLCIEWGPDV